MVRPRIGLALGSGAARGWSHIGVIEALTEADIEPDILCGCSIGALVGAAYVAGELSALKQFAQSLTWREIARMLDVRLSGGGLIAGQEIVALVRKLKISASIASYRKPFAAVATDLQTGREIWLRDGPIEEAVRASISLPGILSPARHADRWLVDGGLVNPVPVSVCRAIGADPHRGHRQEKSETALGEIVRELFGIYYRGGKIEKPTKSEGLRDALLRPPLLLRQLLLRPGEAVEEIPLRFSRVLPTPPKMLLPVRGATPGRAVQPQR